jgi:hypothetical protein
MYAPRLLLLVLLLLQKQPTADKQGTQEQQQKPAASQSVPDVRQQKPEAVVTQARPVDSQVAVNTQKEQDRAQTVKEINDTLLVIFTGLLAIVGLLQWRVLTKHETWMKRNVRVVIEVAKAARKNADAAKVSADAAKDSFQSVIDSERAWVVADAPRVQTDIASGQSVRVLCTVRNRGKTMARVIAKGENYSIEATPDNLAASPDYGKPADWPDGVVLSPASESVLTRTLQVANSETWQRVSNGSMVLFVFGFVKYLDVFNREHESRYIFRFETTWERGGAFYVEYKTEYNLAT